ncbi:DNA polymerase III subunit epsilon [Jiella sp. MQZ9-1]|uniref:DNA polymerase III subunit epsilon n=1 Tax=Jiella flava TaxID=2816857 RepID=A0A939G1T9_9HYPH|nr:DNA polymerase III subunit epsilon [Jiella flava]MBO0663479.1 DNA polymerase III subunit epsilon [Jiella flava]MCD2472054.1 DNA polymerase III subunit epsilon [Jiella flava]
MREIVFDTETTGLDPSVERVIEIGGVELWNHIPTGREYHVFIRPDGRKVDPAAFDVHGISDAFLADKPLFSEVIDEFLAFFSEGRLIAHNAAFDIRFLNAELGRLGHPPIEPERVVDTLPMARRKFPMAPATLDALCSRFSIDTSRRDKHGALLDSQLLAEVYIELIGGRQAALGLVFGGDEQDGMGEGANGQRRIAARPVPLTPRLTADERARHLAFVESLGEEAIWRRYLPASAAEADAKTEAGGV